MDIEILFEFKGSKSNLICPPNGIVEAIQLKIAAFGYKDKKISLDDDVNQDFILQRYSSKWETFIDVTTCSNFCNGDRVTVIPNPAIESPKVNNCVVMIV